MQFITPIGPFSNEETLVVSYCETPRHQMKTDPVGMSRLSICLSHYILTAPLASAQIIRVASFHFSRVAHYENEF